MLYALQRYYLGDISFERVAQDAHITLHELIDYVKEKDLRIVLTDEDRVEGLRRLSKLMEERGLESAVRIAREAYEKLKT